MERKFNTGDVVMLRSGGPAMTVVIYEEDKVGFEDDDEEFEPGIEVVWFLDNVVYENTMGEGLLIKCRFDAQAGAWVLSHD